MTDRPSDTTAEATVTSASATTASATTTAPVVLGVGSGRDH